MCSGTKKNGMTWATQSGADRPQIIYNNDNDDNDSGNDDYDKDGDDDDDDNDKKYDQKINFLVTKTY